MYPTLQQRKYSLGRQCSKREKCSIGEKRSIGKKCSIGRKYSICSGCSRGNRCSISRQCSISRKCSINRKCSIASVNMNDVVLWSLDEHPSDKAFVLNLISCINAVWIKFLNKFSVCFITLTFLSMDWNFKSMSLITVTERILDSGHLVWSLVFNGWLKRSKRIILSKTKRHLDGWMIKNFCLP